MPTSRLRISRWLISRIETLEWTPHPTRATMDGPSNAPGDKMSTRRDVLGGAFAALTAAALPARAQSFPSRPIRIVPFGTAGGPIDTLARVYADKLSARFGQPVIVDP